MIKALISAIAIAVISETAISVYAQEPAAEKIFIYTVEHDHGIGSGKGILRITDAGITFEGDNDAESHHSRSWKDEDIKQIEISKTKLRLIIYEGSRTTIIPRRVPFSGGGKTFPSGSERKYDFRLTGGEIASEAAQAIFTRFNRPIAAAIRPNSARVSEEPLFEIPVYHKHRAGGESGVLRIYDEQIVFEAEAANHSRYWRYADIRDIGRLDRYKFEIATFEKRFGVDGKSYIFELKRPMKDKEYEEIWKRLYDRGRR